MKRAAMLLRRWAMVLAYWVAAVFLFTSLPLWAVGLALVSTLSHGRWRALRADALKGAGTPKRGTA